MIVRKISELNDMKNEYLKKQEEGVFSGLESEVVYLAKIISLAKKTNTPILIVKPFYIFNYNNFTESRWKHYFIPFKHQAPNLQMLRERISEAYSLYDELKDFAYIFDLTEEISAYIHPESDVEDAGKIMQKDDYVHFTATGKAIVGKLIGERLLSLGLVKRGSVSEWVHPGEVVKDEAYKANRRKHYLKYREISLDNKNYKMYLSCFAIVLVWILSVLFMADHTHYS